MNKAIRKLRDEHRSISSVLHGLKELAIAARDAAVQPDFSVFHAMIHYIDTYPERLHHPKEDLHLFPRLLARAPDMAPLVQELRAEHVTGAALVRDLERSLRAFEIGWPQGAERFIDAVNEYADFHWQHMRKEEQLLLTRAEAVLTAEDWSAIEHAFAGNEDPIADLREKDFAQLFSRIVAIAPAPVGLAKSWKRATG